MSRIEDTIRPQPLARMNPVPPVKPPVVRSPHTGLSHLLFSHPAPPNRVASNRAWLPTPTGR